MHGVIDWLFGDPGFAPHGFCLLWRPDLIALHVVSDALIALAYFAIPAAIWVFLRRRNDLQPSHRRIAVLFVVFITACGITHLVNILVLWQPWYGLQALAKAVTAAVSVATAAALPFLVPKLLQIPSPMQLQAVNTQLSAEIAAHQTTLVALERARSGLEHDVAERTEDLRVADARFRAAIANSPMTVYEQDDALRYTWVYNPPFGLQAGEMLGRTETDIMAPADAAALQAVKRRALETGGPVRQEVSARTARGEGWFEMNVEPFQLRDGRAGLIASSVDVTAQKQQQEHLRTVMRELNHRSKNLLTIVQSIARQTARGLDVPEAFLTRLSDRLKALADTHDVLVQENWSGADLRAVIEGQLRPQLDAYGDRIGVRGERVALPAEAAHYMGLALHELGSNATKYGALASEAGRVDISWSIEPDDAEGAQLRLCWRESDGPTVIAAERRGFGRTILEQLTPRAMRGRSELRFEQTGVVWTLSAPLRSA